MNLGENIYRLRTHKNMSQGDLADALEVSRQSVSKWENNSAVPELDKLVKMSQLFGITLDELVGNAPPATSPVPPAESAPPSQAPIGITTNDLVSTIILLFGVAIPVVIIATSPDHNSTILMILALFIIPPLATICAALCSPKNTVLFRVYLVYDIIFGILACISASVLFPLTLIIYIFAAAFWNDRRE